MNQLMIHLGMFGAVTPDSKGDKKKKKKDKKKNQNKNC